ncbi:MAG: hypothetical protein LBR41_01380 [Rickettsiales bacterium]|jgi:uncharacterized membrane protein YozB (DUF420 family)|nr:hypothetical protein [Rickettsiales bacterium]
MKKLLKNLGIGALVVGVSTVAAYAADGEISSKAVCELITPLQSVFKVLRTLSFIGAAFMVAGWAWGFISKGEAKTEDLVKNGKALIIGSVLLVSVGAILQFAVSLGSGETCTGLTAGW